MLIKAEALLMRGMGLVPADNEQAIAIINTIRQRTNLLDVTATANSSLVELLELVISERIMEFVGEGKAWYDLLRVGRYVDPTGDINFIQTFFIPKVITYNETAGENKIKSTLMDKNAWYLPVNEDEIKRNPNLVQNKYYE